MTNPSYVSSCVHLALETLETTEGVAADVHAFWKNRLEAVTAGLNWAPNPQGYILKGLAPAGRRACTIDGISYTSQEFTLRQFKYALQQGWTKEIDVMLRKVSQSNIMNGVFYSAARSDSQYGSKDARKSGYIAELAETSKKNKKELASIACRIEATPSNIGKAIGIQSFNEKLEALKAAHAKRQAPAVAKDVKIARKQAIEDKELEQVGMKLTRKARGGKSGGKAA